MYTPRAAVLAGVAVCAARGVAWAAGVEPHPGGALPVHAAEAVEAVAQAAPQPVPSSPSYARWRREYVGHYENRLRLYSHPQKVFNYFASVKRQGELYMHPVDFVLSILRYQPGDGAGDEAQRVLRRRIEQHCASSLEFFRLADTNGDGLISYQEYILFLVLLATPESQFRVAFQMFDEDGNGVIDLAEFYKIMDTVNAPVKQRMGTREGTRRLQRGEGLLALLFGKDGKGLCRFDDFAAFLRRLHTEVLRLEFFRNPTDAAQTISARDFARCVVSYANRLELSAFAKRIETLPNADARVTFEQFALLDTVVSHLESVHYAIRLYGQAAGGGGGGGGGGTGGGFTKADLKRAMRAAAAVDLPDIVVDTLFHVFDSNGDGALNDTEFLEVLRGRSGRGLDAPRDLGVARLMERLATCWSDA